MKKILLLTFFLVSLFAAQTDVKSFTLTTITNKTIHITVNDEGIKVKEYPNKVIILDFFGKRCPPCQIMIPRLVKLQKAQAKKVQIIGIHVQEPLDLYDMQRLQKIGVTYPVADYLSSKENRAFVEYISMLTNWSGSIPYMLLFDRKGRFATAHVGLERYEDLYNSVEMLYDLQDTKQKRAQKKSSL
ncbi:TlpA disulfide reductase family protein [Nitratiruptor sp. YY09-18]|uniref:TlpA family protein disulfide reductase n=1 Tax=Nitratiruptor sp. YY09-18 TaxID=2724901 RepID=UPI0019163AE2|nr:TlpA disulfide reductase family protein [Nitratiruptor sp. YY09-18]BCD68762.1 thioredoxin 1 [Nitratiruptor sp. YY09-18]